MLPALTIFIDEAGDPGVRDGLKYLGDRHEWLCLAAVAVRTCRDAGIVDWVKEMRFAANSTQAGALHYHRITAARREQVCGVLAEKPVRSFVLASHKSNLREYVNPRIKAMIAGGKFYNWCSRLLLERVTAWAERWLRIEHLDLQPLRIIWAERGGHDYDHQFAYFDRLRMQSETRTLFLKGKGLHPSLLDRSVWSIEPAERNAGLQLADTVASAFYQAANVASPTHDLAPARALAPIIATDTMGSAADCGVTVWPLSHQAELPNASRPIFRHYGYKF